MPATLSRRRLLAVSAATTAALAGCSSGDSDPPATSPGGNASPAEACGTPVGDTWDGVDDSPTPPPCPTRPDPLRACAVREHVLGLEKYLRYARAIERYDGIRQLEYSVSGATVRARSTGFLVHAGLFFAGSTMSGTPPATGTRTPGYFDDTYAVSYLVTPDGQWRATDRTGADRASRAPRRDGSPVSCAGEQSPGPSPSPGTDVADGTVRVESLSVADFVLYPLAGTHPHVHRRAGTQYAVARLDTSFPGETVRERVTLELDGDATPLAERQPVPWNSDTVDVAFAVPKTGAFDGGRVLFDGTELRSLAAATVERLNTPPVFDVSGPSVSPDGISAGERTTATVRFDLANTGDGPGTFGASLTGNVLSGSKTVTATLEAGTRREIAAAVRIAGEGEAATVRLDWGSGGWSADIPVVGDSPSVPARVPGVADGSPPDGGS